MNHFDMRSQSVASIYIKLFPSSTVLSIMIIDAVHM